MDRGAQRAVVHEVTKSQMRLSNWHLIIIKEMQIKTTMKYLLIPVKMAINQKTKDNKYW